MRIWLTNSWFLQAPLDSCGTFLRAYEFKFAGIRSHIEV